MRALGLILLLAVRAQAGPWGLDVGLLAGVGPGGFAGQPAGQDPATLFLPPKVTAGAPLGLLGSAGLDLSLHHKRRWTLSLQPQWRGQALAMDERLDFGGGTVLERKTLWEWQSVAFPLSLHHGRGLWRGRDRALVGRVGAGAWWAGVQGRRKRLDSGVGEALARPWAGPPDDWGPLLAAGLDWLSLPSGRRSAGLELRWERGFAPQDPGAGAGLPAWGLQALLVVPLWMKVL